MDAGKEEDPNILHSGVGGDGDKENGLCVTDDETGFSWQTCSDYSAWRNTESADDNAEEGEGDDDDKWDGTYSAYDDGDVMAQPGTDDDDDNSDGITYTSYSDDILSKHAYLDY